MQSGGNDGRARHAGWPLNDLPRVEPTPAALAALHEGKVSYETIVVRQQKYLNNLVEQDRRNIKRRIRPMLGFKSFRRAQTLLALLALLAGVEVAQMIRKGQYLHPKKGRIVPSRTVPSVGCLKNWQLDFC